MHATRIEFDHAFFIGKAAQSDAIVIRIVFGALDHAEGSVQRVATALQKSKGVVKVIDAVVGTNDDRPLAGAKPPGAGRSFQPGVVLRVPIGRIQATRHRCSNCGT